MSDIESSWCFPTEEISRLDLVQASCHSINGNTRIIIQNPRSGALTLRDLPAANAGGEISGDTA